MSEFCHESLDWGYDDDDELMRCDGERARGMWGVCEKVKWFLWKQWVMGYYYRADMGSHLDTKQRATSSDI